MEGRALKMRNLLQTLYPRSNFISILFWDLHMRDEVFSSPPSAWRALIGFEFETPINQ
jgi:hypothetical protein